MADNNELIRLRGREKSALTRIFNFLEANETPDIEEVQVRLEKLDSIWDNFNLHDSALPDELSELEDFETRFLAIKVRLRKALTLVSRQEGDISIADLSARQTQLESCLLNLGEKSATDFKLPRLNIPTFTGEYMEWSSFKDLFCAAVHNNANISKIQKFQYLKGLLAETPALIIRHIPVAEGSYDEAWSKLIQRYDKKRKIVTSLISTFLSQPKIININESSLRKLADTSDEVVRALKSLNDKATSRDPWLIYLLLEKVDTETRQLWAEKITDDEFPSIENFIEFLNKRCSTLEVSYTKKQKEPPNIYKSITSGKINTSYFTCIKCRGDHPLFKCMKFKELDTSSRKDFVRKKGLCTNCLSDKHKLFDCKSTFVCNKCKGKHHSLLHENMHNCLSTTISKESVKPVQVLDSTTSNVALSVKVPENVGLLPTAIVSVQDNSGNTQDARILCDSGSQRSFVSEAFIQRLGLQRKNARFPVTGIGGSKASLTRGLVKLQVASKYDPNSKFKIDAYILNKLIDSLPSKPINLNSCHLNNIQLADPGFSTPDTIDMILGADCFFSVLLPGQINGPEEALIAQNSKFGWLISGKRPADNIPKKTVSFFSQCNIDQELKRFWEVESVPETKNKGLTPEEEFCESHFKENYTYASDGRFVVKLPFYNSDLKLGNSKGSAFSRLLSMERKMERDKTLESDYKSFMQEYEALDHMRLANDKFDSINDQNKYYLPHHAVIKSSSTTTKLRVVFDASCPTKNSVSLNSILGVGPKIQKDLFDIILNFRLHKIVFSADIEKMYRQILIAPTDQTFQRILWRYHANEPIREYKLRTVTYGLSSASFLATRCLKQIALDNRDKYPKISEIIENNFFMDDLLSGSNSIEQAILICKQLSNLLLDRGFSLRKWCSNSPEFLKHFNDNISHDSNVEIQDEKSTKILGLYWDSKADNLQFNSSLKIEVPFTKRKILSQTARLFDPLGLLSPCTVSIKILYQKLWQVRCNWDDPIPKQLEEEWIKFQNAFNDINFIKIPRWVSFSDNNIQLHGFSDASELAYAAAIYVRSQQGSNIKVNLLVSKTKVAPIKQLSIPKLELCGALLLSKLFRSVIAALENFNLEIFAWTDSKVTLAWLSAHPRKWKIFIANRTSEILDHIPLKNWNYVASKQNPADIASRGINPGNILHCDLWWNGPEWLSKEKNNWPKTEIKENKEALTEQKSNTTLCFNTSSENNILNDLFKCFSSFLKISRIVAYCLRFIVNCKKLISEKPNEKRSSNSNIRIIPLRYSEIIESTRIIIRWVQGLYFSYEIEQIKSNLDLKKSILRSLYPFLDKDSILRVGGRIQNSDLAFSTKHPVILPYQHKISELLIKQYHITYLHAGPTLLSHILRQSYWIIGGRKLIRKCINKCVICFRFKSSNTTQLMGNLPEHRVKFKRAFLYCGLDYAGPIPIKLHKGRGSKSTKGYICLFICLSTKALHLEAVTDLSADTFISALKRFSSRRGAPTVIYSDNATNFVGARRKLSEFSQFIASLNEMESVSHYLNENRIEWHMIPPSAPHFGGIWEAGVRSVKFHLKRMLSGTLLTYEELTTLLAQIEAVLNSRPLTYTTDSDPDCINILTPSHFITGDIITVPGDQVPGDQMSQPYQISYNSRWELTQRLYRGFWKRWHKEYLNSLQQRKKWQTPQTNLALDDVVLIRNDDTPPSSWPLGRISALHPGKDGQVRVVSVTTPRGILKRPVVKLSRLPIYPDNARI